MKRFWLGLCLAAIGGVFYSWLQAPAWLEEWNSSHQAVTEQQRRAGLQFGQSSDQQACLEKALQQFDLCAESDYSCTVSNGLFLRACWQASQPSSGFCDGVPAFSESPSEDDKAWAKERCFALGITGSGCRILMRQKQQLCSATASD